MILKTYLWMMKNWYDINNSDELDSPALVIYPSRIKENIRRIKNIVSRPECLRPHVKTHKTREVAIMLMEAGIKKFKCATIAEAEMLGMTFAPDVLLAYQPVGPKVQRFISLVKSYPRTVFSCLIDDSGSAIHLSNAALEENLLIRVYIDLNVGMNRTGITPGKKAIQLYQFCSSLACLEPVGFHLYDGHLGAMDAGQRRLACNASLAAVEVMTKKLEDAGHSKPLIIAGGTPSLPIYAEAKDVECSPGTFVFWDGGYQQLLGDLNFLTAALVITRIVSLPDERKICLDLGYKSIASENSINHRVYFLNAPELKIISQSEEHLVVEAPSGHLWKVGDLLYGLPVHICPTCALYESAAIVEDGVIVDSWRIISRDRKIYA